MNKRVRRLCFTSAACTVLALLGACGKQEASAPAAAGSTAATARVYTVGTDAAYAPFESQNGKGEIVLRFSCTANIRPAGGMAR